MSLPEINYQHFPLNRASNFRKNPEWLAEQVMHKSANFMLINQGDYLFDQNHIAVLKAGMPLSQLNENSLERLLIVTESPLFLGLEEKGPLFLIDCSSLSESIINEFFPQSEQALSPWQWLPFKSSMVNIESELLAILGYGRAIAHWNFHYQFCGICGHKTETLDGGHRRKCSNEPCGKEHFPRTDPAVIMLIEYQPKTGPAKCLLAQHHRQAKNVVSTLAGFVDPGETLEQTVAREAFEEAGVIVNNIEYVTTQPWPFPGSLMIGFRAQALSDKITVDVDEIIDAQWFTAAEVRSFDDWGEESEHYKIPRKGSISRYLIESWLQTQK